MFMTIGFLILIGGVAGYVVPGLPGTPLLLVAAWLFSMSNERLYRWMTTNRWFGQTIADYRAGLGISRRVKSIALALTGVAFILTRPTRESVLENA